MVKLSILSLLDNTNFSGDIVILTDANDSFEDLKIRTSRVTVIDIVTDNPVLSTKKLTRFNIFCLKSFVMDFVDLKKYKFCLYVDADVLFNLPNLDEALNYFTSIGKIQISDNDGWTVAKRHHTTGVQVLTESEIEDNKSFGVCAGIIGIPCNELGFSLLKDWKDMNLSGNLELDDQGNLTALLLRKYKNSYSFMPFLNKNRWVLKDITHYCSGSSKPMFWHHGRSVLKKYRVDLPDLAGYFRMEKIGERLSNTWYIEDSIVYVDNPQITGFVQKTLFGYYIWWASNEGFEIISKDLQDCKSFRNGTFSIKPMKHSNDG